jgi:inhibitor of KinA sporulation pathway (predicted exonuclease)
MQKDNLKQVVISIVIGACVAFFSTLFTELAAFLKTHSTEVISAMATTGTYLAKTYKG